MKRKTLKAITLLYEIKVEKKKAKFIRKYRKVFFDELQSQLKPIMYAIKTFNTPLSRFPSRELGLHSAAASREVPTLSVLAGDRTLRGEVDWIIARCCAREIEARYPNAGALADDLARGRCVYGHEQPAWESSTPPSPPRTG